MKTHMTGALSALVAAGTVSAAALATGVGFDGRDAMVPLPPGAVKLSGGLEVPIEKSIAHWHKGNVPYREFAEFFRKGRPKFALGEMWGKFVRSGAMQYRHRRDPELKAVLDGAVADILATERSNGSISCVPEELQPGGDGHSRPHCSDLWERKYVMLALEDYYEWVERRPEVLASLQRQADCLVRQVGPAPKRDIREIGWSPNCIESSSLLEPFMRLHKLTGRKDYLDFARYIVESGGAKGSDLFAQARAGVMPWRMGEPYPKAYEMTSIFEGLAEWHRVTGDASAREAVLKYFDSVLRHEITIVGNGGGNYPHWPRWSGEAWDNTAAEQSNPDMTRMMETCVGVTWMKYASQVLRLTGDVRAADAIELYIYNGLLGAMKPDGDGFSYVNLLNGEKVTNKGWGWTFASGPVTCCNLNGPMGLAYIPFVAVMQAQDGPVVNLYNAGIAVGKTASGGEVRLAAEGDLLDRGGWRMTVSPAREESFTVSLRIPAWSEKTSVTVNGVSVGAVIPGKYLKIARAWHAGDKVAVAFDFKARKLDAPVGRNHASAPFQAVVWGPIALARDENTDPNYAAPVAIQATADGTVAVERITPASPAHKLEFRVPTKDGFIVMCDYASVDGWKGKHVQTWLPKAMSAGTPKLAETTPVSCIGLKRSWDPSPGWWEKRHAEKLAQIAASGGKIDLVFVGDSITHNWEGARGPGSDYGGKPLAELKRKYSVLNLGFGGDSTQNVLWRLENGELDGYKAKCIMLMIGTNNGGRPENTAAGIRAILDLIARKQPQAVTILLPIFPSGATADHPWRTSKKKINAIIKGFADGKKVVWCDFNDRFLNPDGTFPKGMMMADNLHPLAPGYEIWAEEVTPLFKKICDGMMSEFVSPQEKAPANGAAAVFEKSFANKGIVRRATWDVTAQGVFEAFANGRRVGNDFLKPGVTECGKCRHVYSYDVTGLLDRRAGATNVLSATVTPGWWCDQMMRPPDKTPNWQRGNKREWQLGKEIAFRGELHLEFPDGSAQTVGTDESWRAAYTGPLVSAGIYEGEVYDARRQVEGLKGVRRNTEFAGELRPAAAKIALREDLMLTPREVYVVKGVEGASKEAFGVAKVIRRDTDGEDMRLEPGEMLVIDFGQNCSAVPSFEVTGEAGAELEIRAAEMLNESHGEKSRGNDGPAGTPYLASLRKAYAGIRYTLKDGRQSYMPRYTYFGYRYLGVTATRPVVFARWRSTPVSSVTREMERGRIVTGNARVNRLIANIRWGLLSNYLSSPTDCPQRDERMGWTADTQVFMNSAAYFADTREFLGKYLADLRDAQRASGCYMCFVPNVRHTFAPWASAGWTDAGVIIPYRLWKWYGDRRFVDASWESMVRYMDFLEGHAEPYRINHGDWLAFEHHKKNAGDAMDGRQVKALNAYFRVWMAMLMREMAAATGRGAAERHYSEEEAKLRQAFAAAYVGPDGTIKDEFKGQCNDLYMLKLGLCGGAAAVEATKRDLIDNIKACGNRLQTGFLGTAILMPTLTFEANAPELAYSLLLQDAFPSWLYSVDQGATTVWERWNGYTKEKGFGPVGMNSFNHYAYGCVAEWLFAAAAGIRQQKGAVGWKRFVLAPIPDRRLGSLDASFVSPEGEIRSSWQYGEDGKWTWTFAVPKGTLAIVSAPGIAEREYGPGEWTVTSNLASRPDMDASQQK